MPIGLFFINVSASIFSLQGQCYIIKVMRTDTLNNNFGHFRNFIIRQKKETGKNGL